MRLTRDIAEKILKIEEDERRILKELNEFSWMNLVNRAIGFIQASLENEEKENDRRKLFTFKEAAPSDVDTALTVDCQEIHEENNY